jgi:hypothetical protein
MKTLNRILLFTLVTLIFTACAPTQASSYTPIPPVNEVNNPYAPQSGDGSMLRGDVRIDSASVNVAESNPPQATLNFAYFLPTPCFQLRTEVTSPDAQNRINVSAYAVAEKGKACTLMALATPLKASLPLGTFPKGHYEVWLNGSKVGEFDA